jgi:hypothetical protein
MMQCPLALNGRGPIPGHCARCDLNLMTNKPYRVWDHNGHVITCTVVEMRGEGWID